MSALGHEQTFALHNRMSALAPIATAHLNDLPPIQVGIDLPAAH